MEDDSVPLEGAGDAFPAGMGYHEYRRLLERVPAGMGYSEYRRLLEEVRESLCRRRNHCTGYRHVPRVDNSNSSLRSSQGTGADYDVSITRLNDEDDEDDDSTQDEVPAR